MAKLCAQQDGGWTAYYFKKFGLDPKTDKPDIIEIAKLCAQQDGEGAAEYFENFGLDPETDIAIIIEIAKLCAQQDGVGTACFFKNFGLDPGTDKLAIIEIAKLCAQQNGEGTARYFENFGLDPKTDKHAIIEIAKLCAQQDGWGTADEFKNFGLDPVTDKPVIIEIAKLCAQQNGEGTAYYFKNFGLDPETDIAAIIEIARLCYAQNSQKTEGYFYDSELYFNDMTSLIRALNTIEGEDWPIILTTIDKPSDINLIRDDLKKIFLNPSIDENTILAINVKQRLYRQIRRNEGVELPEYRIPQDKLSSYTGCYKLPWSTFRKFMDKHYNEFHKDPSKFIKDPAEMDLSETGSISLKQFESPDMAKGKNNSEFDTRILRDISGSEELVRCLKGEILSAAFDKTIVFAFTKELGMYQQENPLRRVKEALKKLKDKPAYKKILENLVIIEKPIDESPGELSKYIDDKNARVFLFADASVETKEKIRNIKDKVNSIFIDETDFRSMAYYPLAEIVVLTLAEYYDRTIKEGELKMTLEIAGKNLELASLNIESIRRDGNSLIFKLLPAAKEHDAGELVKRYAAIMPFLEAA